jgi:CheY-like chemotaxis protein
MRNRIVRLLVGSVAIRAKGGKDCATPTQFSPHGVAMTSGQLFVEPQACGPPNAPQRTLLIVEDDESIAEVLSIRLQRQGFQTLRASTGAEALSLAREQLPRLVLLDLRLPDIDGFSICQTLVDDPATCGMPVIILSGMERPDIVRRSREAGCRYYVRKPYDPDALLALIQHALDEADSTGL